MARMLVLGMLLFGFLSNEQQEKKPDTKTPITAEKLEKARKAGQALVGRLVRVDGENRTLSIEVTFQIPQVNDGAVRRLAQIQSDLAKAQLKGDINQIRSLGREAASQQAVTYREEKRMVEFVAEDDAKVRTMLLPIEYTEKGKPKRLTEKEKKDLKGSDPKLRGYSSDFDNLQMNQILEVYPVPVRVAQKSTKTSVKATPKPESVGDPKEETPRIKLSMIVIVAEPAR